VEESGLLLKRLLQFNCAGNLLGPSSWSSWKCVAIFCWNLVKLLLPLWSVTRVCELLSLWCHELVSWWTCVVWWWTTYKLVLCDDDLVLCDDEQLMNCVMCDVQNMVHCNCELYAAMRCDHKWTHVPTKNGHVASPDRESWTNQTATRGPIRSRHVDQ
jgi:hypothetical protein